MNGTTFAANGQRISFTGRMSAQLRQATAVALENCEIDPDVFPRLAELGRLTGIDLLHCAVGDDIFDCVARFASLQQLRLRGCGITTAGLLRLSGRRLDLTVLELLDEPGIGDGIMPLLAQFPRLKVLSLSGAGLENPDMAYLTGAPLSELSLNRTSVGDTTVLSMRSATLYDLYLGNTRVTAASLEVIAGCPNLGRLYLPPGVATTPQLKAFHALHPGCLVQDDEDD